MPRPRRWSVGTAGVNWESLWRIRTDLFLGEGKREEGREEGCSFNKRDQGREGELKVGFHARSLLERSQTFFCVCGGRNK